MIEKTNKKYPEIEEENMIVSEPISVTFSEGVNSSGLLGQVMSLSNRDKKALIAYLEKEMNEEGLFQNDEFGRIILTPKMLDAIHKAERSYEDGSCLTEESFKSRFAKWL